MPHNRTIVPAYSTGNEQSVNISPIDLKIIRQSVKETL